MEQRAFDMLLYLIQHRDRAISKDELQEAIWPRLVLTESALTRCVMKVRRAVGDDPTRQDVVKTVHGHGYRFVAPLKP
jgi:DNA-binding winged helix-turn-helix (wHTH) protein